jgi:hypothetical protein
VATCSTSWSTRTPIVTPANASPSCSWTTKCNWCRSSRTSFVGRRHPALPLDQTRA